MNRFRNSIVLAFLMLGVIVSYCSSSAAVSLLQGRRRSNHVVELTPKAKVKLTYTRTRIPFLTDRKYAIRKLPRGVFGGSLVLRNSGQSNGWLDGKQLVAKKACTAFVAVQIGRNGKLLVPADLDKKMKADGWKPLKGFLTTSPAKEAWSWLTFSRPITKGPVKLPNSAKLRTNMVFMFK